jgi:H+/Cl- antiporter ClcA
MGASLGTLVSRLLVPDEDDHKILHASGAGAGLAVAFNTRSAEPSLFSKN